MNRTISSLALLLFAVGCSRAPDPCSGVMGTCLGVEVQAQTSEQVASLDVLLRLNDGPTVPRMTTPPEGQPTGFPLLFPVVLGQGFAGKVEVIVEARLGGQRLRGQGQAVLAAGEHGRLTIQLLDTPVVVDMGGGDQGAPDLLMMDLRPPDVPAARYAAAAAYLPAPASALIIHGGIGPDNTLLSDTWSWNGRSWTQLRSGDPPAGQAGCMAYDSRRGMIVHYGGFTKPGLDGTSTQTSFMDRGGTWSRFSPTSFPALGRAGCAMIYDSSRGTIIMHGGTRPENATGLLSDTWELPSAGSQWFQRNTTGPRLSFHNLVQDGTGRILMFGADDGTSVKVWRWDPASFTWISLAVAGTPPSARSGVAAAFDPSINAVVVHGGADRLALNETYLFRTSSWSRVAQTAEDPPGRSNAVMEYDTARTTIVLFGGRALSRVLNDMYTLKGGATWSKVQ
jgi:hypothetical protein